MTTVETFAALLDCRLSHRWQAMAGLHATLNAAGIVVRFDVPRELGDDATLYVKAGPLFAAWLAAVGVEADRLAVQLDRLGVIVRGGQAVAA